MNGTVKITDVGLGIECGHTIAKIVQRNSAVRKLNLSKNALKDGGAYCIARVLPRTTALYSLDLSSNDLTYKGSNALLQQLNYNESLVQLDLSSHEGGHRNRLGPKGIECLS